MDEILTALFVSCHPKNDIILNSQPAQNCFNLFWFHPNSADLHLQQVINLFTKSLCIAPHHQNAMEGSANMRANMRLWGGSRSSQPRSEKTLKNTKNKILFPENKVMSAIHAKITVLVTNHNETGNHTCRSTRPVTCMKILNRRKNVNKKCVEHDHGKIHSKKTKKESSLQLSSSPFSPVTGSIQPTISLCTVDYDTMTP